MKEESHFLDHVASIEDPAAPPPTYQPRHGILAGMYTFFRMRVLASYLLKTILVTFGMALLIVTFVMLAGSLTHIYDLLFKRFSFIIIIHFLATALPGIICYALPFSMAASTLLIYSRLSADGEITAMKASGISIFRISSPTILLSFCVGLIALVMYNNVLPYVNYAQHNILASYEHQDPAALIETGTWIPLNRYRLFVDARDGDTYRNITIVEDIDGTRIRRIDAQRGTVTMLHRENRVLLRLYELVSEERSADYPDSYLRMHASQADLRIDMGQLARQGRRALADRTRPRDLTTRELREQVSTLWTEIDEIVEREGITRRDMLRRIRRGKTLWSSLRGHPTWRATLTALNTSQSRAFVDIVGRNMFSTYNAELLRQAPPGDTAPDIFQEWYEIWPQAVHYRLEFQSRCRAEIHYRYAYAFATVAFAIIGIPLGIRAHRSEKSIGFLICIILVAIFYTLITTAKSFDDTYEIMPYYLIWVPNLLFLVTGAVLLIRNHKLS